MQAAAVQPGPSTASVTHLLVLANLVVFVLELSQPTVDALRGLVDAWGMVPREYVLGHDLAPAIPVPFWATLFTSMFLHGGWLHLAGNMVYLLLLGDGVERRLGHARFLGVYLLCGAAAGLMHVAANPASTIPTVGASGAVSGLVGGYLPLLWGSSRCSLRLGLVRLVALTLVGLWIANGMIEVAYVSAYRDIAVFAHVGGFLSGLTAGLGCRITDGQRQSPVEAGPPAPAEAIVEPWVSPVDCGLPAADC